MGPGARPELRHAQLIQKCLEPRQHSHKKELHGRQAINLALPRRVRLWGTAPEARGWRTTTNSQRNQDTPDQIRVPTNTADRSVADPSAGGGSIYFLFFTKMEGTRSYVFVGEGKGSSHAISNCIVIQSLFRVVQITILATASITRNTTRFSP